VANDRFVAADIPSGKSRNTAGTIAPEVHVRKYPRGIAGSTLILSILKRRAAGGCSSADESSATETMHFVRAAFRYRAVLRTEMDHKQIAQIELQRGGRRPLKLPMNPSGARDSQLARFAAEARVLRGQPVIRNRSGPLDIAQRWHESIYSCMRL